MRRFDKAAFEKMAEYKCMEFYKEFCEYKPEEIQDILINYESVENKHIDSIIRLVLMMALKTAIGREKAGYAAEEYKKSALPMARHPR